MYYFMEFSTLKPTKLVKISLTLIKNQYFYYLCNAVVTRLQISDLRCQMHIACAEAQT